MAVYAFRGVSALAYGSWLYGSARRHIFTSWIKKAQSKITEGDLVQYVQTTAQKLGIQKDVVVLRGVYGSHVALAGNHMLPGPVALILPNNLNWNHPSNKIQIIGALCDIRANNGLKLTIIPPTFAIATHLLLNSRSPIGSSLAGITVLVASVVMTMLWTAWSHRGEAMRILNNEVLDSFLPSA